MTLDPTILAKHNNRSTPSRDFLGQIYVFDKHRLKIELMFLPNPPSWPGAKLEQLTKKMVWLNLMLSRNFVSGRPTPPIRPQIDSELTYRKAKSNKDKQITIHANPSFENKAANQVIKLRSRILSNSPRWKVRTNSYDIKGSTIVGKWLVASRNGHPRNVDKAPKGKR